MGRLFCNLYKGQDFYLAEQVHDSFESAKKCESYPNYIGTYELIEAKQEQPQPEQHSSELKTMLIADAIEAGLKKGDRVSIEFEVTQNPSKTTQKTNLTLKTIHSGQIFYAKVHGTQIKIEPKSFEPKHGEKCIVQTHESIDKYECTAVEIKGKMHAYVEIEGEDVFFFDTEIKQFLPLE